MTAQAQKISSITAGVRGADVTKIDGGRVFEQACCEIGDFDQGQILALTHSGSGFTVAGIYRVQKNPDRLGLVRSAFEAEFGAISDDRLHRLLRMRPDDTLEASWAEIDPVYEENMEALYELVSFAQAQLYAELDRAIAAYTVAA